MATNTTLIRILDKYQEVLAQGILPEYMASALKRYEGLIQDRVFYKR